MRLVMRDLRSIMVLSLICVVYDLLLIGGPNTASQSANGHGVSMVSGESMERLFTLMGGTLGLDVPKNISIYFTKTYYLGIPICLMWLLGLV